MWIKHVNDIGTPAPGDLTIHRENGEDIHVAKTLDDIMIKLEVMSEVMDEILAEVDYQGMSIENRMQAKIMMKKLSK